MTDSVLFGLKVTSHLFAHTVIFSRSKLSVAAAVAGLSTIIYKFVSSAKSLIYEFMSRTIPFKYMRKRSGPNIDPCGTPAVIEAICDEPLGRTTFCFLSLTER
jgi:hypothetical protein